MDAKLTPGAVVVLVPVDDIRPHPENPKGHDLPTLCASIRRFGFAEPVVVDQRTGLNVSGHGRVEAVQQIRSTGEEPPAGITDEWELPVYAGWASKDDDEARAVLVALNRITETGGWDDAPLLELLERIGDDVPTGFGEDDLATLRRKLDAIGADPVSAQEAWDAAGMPDYEQNDLESAFRTIIHFPTVEDADRFFREVLGAQARKRTLWWPDTDGHHGATVKAEYVVAD